MSQTASQSRPTSGGRGCFYMRDSGGRHEQSPASYVEWAASRARELGVRFSGTPEAMHQMMAGGEPQRGDLYFDNAVCGNRLSRPALDALRHVIQHDQDITHLFIFRRDRLARPDDAADGVRMEAEFRSSGVTLVFHDKILPPLRRGQRQDLGEAISAYIDYDNSGRFRDDLAEKMLHAQIQLARRGFSTGGRPPFGFRRVLVDGSGRVVRPLQDGEIVRQAGHHVVWLPGPDHELDLIRRILSMLESVPANRIAKQLNQEGIPSPDAGRMRRDGGVLHAVSGLWHATTITGIARNPLLRAVTIYGRRAMGDRRRLSTNGPRLLESEDYGHGKRPKVVQNQESERISAPAHFEPIVPVDQVERLQNLLNTRGGTQRGKPRSRNPDQNPLGGRVFDMACGWPMYRVPLSGTFRYTCGYYLQSNGDHCDHNWVHGPQATRFVLAAIRQQLQAPHFRELMVSRLQEKLRASASTHPAASTAIEAKRSELSQRESQINQVTRNMVYANGPEMVEVFQAELRQLKSQADQLRADLQALEAAAPRPSEKPDDRLTACLNLLDQLPKLAESVENLPAITELFRRMNVQLYLQFSPEKKKKRVLNKLRQAILTTGNATAPIRKYAGPTGRRALHQTSGTAQPAAKSGSAGTKCPDDSSQEDESLGNTNRGDKTAIELFLAGVRGWEAGLRRFLCPSTDGK
ncbi:hypothetical protein GC163_12490 [bacterium]|nr:hypothetical protein [bacterium]